MMKNNFPRLLHDTDVKCFNCGISLASAQPQDKGYADGAGRFRKTCVGCGYHTYYDLLNPSLVVAQFDDLLSLRYGISVKSACLSAEDVVQRVMEQGGSVLRAVLDYTREHGLELRSMEADYALD